MKNRIHELESLLIENCWHLLGDNYFCHHCGCNMSMVLAPEDRWKSHKPNCPVFDIEKRRNADSEGGVK